MTSGENITRLRTEKGMSQGALAEALEVSRQSVSKWETDASVPELEKLIRLAKLFGVTLDELVTGEKAPGDPVQTSSTPEVVFVERKRETRKTVGAALLAGVGIGVFRDVYEASAKVEKSVYMEIKHNDQHKEVYDRRYQVYTGLYPSVKELYKVNLGIE